MLFGTMQQQSPAAVICHCYHGYSSEQKHSFSLCGTSSISKLYAFPLSFNSQIIIPLIQHLGINVYHLAVLISKLGGLLSPQQGNDIFPRDCKLL